MPPTPCELLELLLLLRSVVALMPMKGEGDAQVDVVPGMVENHCKLMLGQTIEELLEKNC